MRRPNLFSMGREVTTPRGTYLEIPIPPEAIQKAIDELVEGYRQKSKVVFSGLYGGGSGWSGALHHQSLEMPANEHSRRKGRLL